MKETQGQPITAVTKLAGERFRALGEEEQRVVSAFPRAWGKVRWRLLGRMGEWL